MQASAWSESQGTNPIEADPFFSVRDRVITITGGLGQLGQAFAKALVERGARVALLDIDAERGRLARTLLLAERERQLILVSGNVTDKASVANSVATITDALGTPYGLLNCAAIDAPPNAPVEDNGPFETYSESSWDRVMDVNVKGAFLCCQAFGKSMADAKQGTIVNIASIYGLLAPDQSIYEYRRARGETFYKPAAYSASKSAIYNLTRYLAVYWAKKNVRVNTATFSGVFADQDAEFLEAYNRRIPIGRMALPDDFCAGILFLMSDGSRYMTGSNLTIDGGWTAI